MAKYSASEIAEWFLMHNQCNVENGADAISNLKLQKLLYYAQGAHLAITGKALFSEPIKAWTHGPVVADIYHKYKEYGSLGITPADGFECSDIDDKTEAILIQVYNAFGQFSAWKLRELTHSETPWQDTDLDDVIPQKAIKQYFEENHIEHGEKE